MSTHNVAPAHGGTTYTDTSPRIPVTADAPECDYSLFCVWVPFWSSMTGCYRWALKSCHGRCPVHQMLLRSRVPR